MTGEHPRQGRTGSAAGEQANERLRRMFAALSATNEAILRADSPGDLYQSVCDAAVEGGGLIMTAVLMPGPDSSRLTLAASTGVSEALRRGVRISIDPAEPEGEGLAGPAFRSGRPCVSNDLLNDPRTRPWHETARRAGVAAGAAVPLIRGDRTTGVLLFYADEPGAFDAEEEVGLLERMAENVVFALENFEHEEERRRNRERIEHMATHDTLTDLPNRAMFQQMLTMCVETGRRYGQQFAVMFIDLDGFKLVNDSLGHEAGDALLQEMARRFTSCLRASDVVARLGGDEFVVLMQRAGDPQAVHTVARKLVAATMTPVALAGQECRVTASIGIAVYPEHGADAATLMKNADLAMHGAKEEGKNGYRLFSADIKTRSLERMTLETRLRRALEHEELALAYRAKVELHGDAVSGVEALLRWHSDELGRVPTEQILPLAEETGLIIPIGHWMLRTACRQSVEWQRQGLPALRMALRLSPRQASDPALCDHVERALDETGMPPDLLELELSERVVFQDTRKALRLLEELKRIGVRVAIDDFGSGYAALARLKHSPIDTVRMNRSFIRELPKASAERSILEAIVSLGTRLGPIVAAEAMQAEDQRIFLRDPVCEEIHGFYCSPPLAPDALAAMVKGTAPA